MIRSALERQQIYAQMSRGADELEPALLAALEQAGCTREQVGAHLALGLYYLQRGDTARVQAHLSFVAARGNKLKVREEAERLLRFSDKPLIAIASYLSFSSQSHFQNTFKKITGTTPTQYQRQWKTEP